MFALIDCNSFYASCERVFRPDLVGKPVIVLSNNDGCVIARSKEAKTAGVRMGAPFYQVRDLCRKNGVHTFSSNYALYGDLSSRVMQTLQLFSPSIEQYSIDEAFLQVNGIESALTGDWPHRLMETVGRWTGIPVSVGIAATKTLAKVANHHAKDTGSGFHCLLNEVEIDTLLTKLPPDEVWGVASRTTRKLNALGIWTALDLKNADPLFIRDKFGIVLERTVRELRGEPCLALEEDTEFRQSIQVSRSFGNLVSDYADLEQAVAAYATRAGEKLRRQDCVAGGIYVYLRTNPHQKEDAQYSGGVAGGFELPTDSTFALTSEALRLLKRIYKEGYLYQKAGVMLLDMSRRGAGQGHEQGSLFAPEVEVADKRQKLMQVIDGLNERHGRGTIRLGAQGFDDRGWKLRCHHRSPRYTTNWLELPNAN